MEGTMNVRTLFNTLLTLALLVPAAAQAQEPERGQLYDVSVMKVSPDNIDEFMETVGMIRAAAEAADLAPEWGWQIWVSNFEVAVVVPAEDMASFDDEEAWLRAYAGTPGEEMLAEAFGRMEAEVAVLSTTREVWELEEAWSYVPAEGGITALGFAEMFEFWVKPGMQAAFEEVSAEVGEFLGELGGPYPVNAFRPIFGDVGRVVYTAFHDGWADFYGPQSMEAGLAAAGKTGEWEAIMNRYRDCISDSKSSQWAYMADLSYPAAGM